MINSRRQWLAKMLAAGALALAMLSPATAREVVPFRGYAAGSIVIVTHARELYYVLGQGQAIRYPVGVGKAGMAWHGRANIAQKNIRPAWVAVPGVTQTIPGGSPRNPMGAAAMGLGSRQLRHPRHQRSVVDRRLRLARLHPHVQRGHHRPVPARVGRHAGGGKR